MKKLLGLYLLFKEDSVSPQTSIVLADIVSH